MLHKIGLIDELKNDDGIKVFVATECGRKASLLPISPKFAKVLISSLNYSKSTVYWACVIVAGISVNEIFTDVIY